MKKASATKATTKKATPGETTSETAAKALSAGDDEAAAETADAALDTQGTDAATPAVGGADPAQDAPTDDPADAADAKDGDEEPETAAAASPFGLLFQAPDLSAVPARQPRSRRAEPTQADAPSATAPEADSTDSATDASGATPAPTGSPRGRGTRRGGQSETQGRGQSTQGGTQQGGPQQGGPQQGETQQGGAQQGSVQQGGAQQGPDDSDSDGRGADRGPQGGWQGEDDSDDSESANARRRRRRGGKGRRGRGGSLDDSGEGQDEQTETTGEADDTSGETTVPGEGTSSNVRRRRRSNRRGEDTEAGESRRAREEVTGVRGSTRLEAKRQRRREGREAGRRRSIITEAEFLARRESVERTMVVRGLKDRTQIGVLEDGVLVEHYVSRETQTTAVGNVYLGRVQNVLPSMEAAFVDIGKGRNAVLYAGEVNWDAAGLDNNQPKRIENALKSGDSVLVQVTKDPIGHKGARLTSQVSLPGRYLVLVPGNSMTGISRKLPDTERARLKKILKEVVPEGAGVIVRTAAEGASEEELRADVERLTGMWQRIESKQKSANAPALVHGEPDMTVRVIRDVFNEDFAKVIVSGEQAWTEVSDYISSVAPDLAERLEKWTGTQDVFTHYRVTEALSKAMDRKVWLPSGGSLVIDRTEAMTVVDVNTGKFVGSGGNLEETVTKNNIEAAEEIVRQLRLRDIGGIIVIDFIDMVLESNRDLVVRRLLECLGRDRTKHQVAEVTSLGLVQMTRKRVGAGLIEVFSEPCVHCSGRGIVVHSEPIEKSDGGGHHASSSSGGGRRGRGRTGTSGNDSAAPSRPTPAPGGPTPAQIAAAAHAAAVASSAQASAKVADDPVADSAAVAGTSAAADGTPESTDAPKSTGTRKSTGTPRRSGGATVWRPPSAATPADSPELSTSAADPSVDSSGAAPAAAPSPVATTPDPAASSEPPAPRVRGARRASRRAQSAPKAPPAAETAAAPAPQTRVAGTTGGDAAPVVTAGTGRPEAVHVDADTGPAQESPAAPTQAPTRRRGRGRVVAPAGPPTGAPTDATGSPDGQTPGTSAGSPGESGPESSH
ncbi:Rne/Rng family ribonuclease [Ornithinimicrobium ciconiae]|uniref:Rne/Rng family ribonuclease n=1 Tax=Ornithinimicrobium ciconiae TaxID=2594265 RepID=UPI002AA2A1BD|nr:Rne/Rng family ribonuclease [Ornithinimicrobium ciconiae]